MHTPVLVSEVVDLLRPGPGHRFIDGTLGLGGHALALLPRLLPGGRLLGIDCDESSLSAAAARLGKFSSHIELVHGNFRDIGAIAARSGFDKVEGIVMDLGVSSRQLDDPERGFSFTVEGPLDMRLDRGEGTTAAMVLRRSSARELERVFRDYGEERYARRIARAVVAERGRLRTTLDLARLVERTVPRRERRLHPATRVFLSLRLIVNQELAALDEALSAAAGLLAPGGRIGVIAFHSLEDRIVKNRFRGLARAGEVALVTPKPVRPSASEVSANRRARSAKLRVCERLGA